MSYKVTVVGVGMVGEQIVSILKERDLPIAWPPRVCATRERTETLAGEEFLVEEISPEEARELLAAFPGVIVLDELSPDNPRRDPLERSYPDALDLRKPEYQDAVLVGRIREDQTVENGLNLWCVADNLRKGAALNVVQIMEGLIERGLLK